MNKIICLLAITCFISCNSTDEATRVESASTKESDATPANYPYIANYSSDFEMGDPKNSTTILNLWKNWESGDLMAGKESFADTVEIQSAGGVVLHGSRDSVVAQVQRIRSTMGTVHCEIDAFLPVKSRDKDEQWVCVWGKEVRTDKNGKMDSVFMEESWRLNKQGKVDFMLQYARSAPPAMK